MYLLNLKATFNVTFNVYIYIYIILYPQDTLA